MPQHVLLIDDSPAVHTLLQARLKDEPVVLQFAASGEEGLVKARTTEPDLILLDVDMPAPNGFEVCRRLKLDQTLHSIPVIFLTGAGATEDRIRGLELGAIDYITKPFEAAELRARVRAGLRMKFMIDLLAKKAQIDALTGLWNRRYFDQRLEAEISLANRAGRTLSVMLLDLDHFTSINDHFGHAAGDEALRRIGNLLVESVRTEDIVCRYGGERFAIIVPNAAGGVAELAERLRKRIEGESFLFAGVASKITTSIGIVSAGGKITPSVVAAADAALHLAKASGRNRVETAPTTSQAIKPAA